MTLQEYSNPCNNKQNQLNLQNMSPKPTVGLDYSMKISTKSSKTERAAASDCASVNLALRSKASE